MVNCWTELYLVAVCRRDAPGYPGSEPAAALWLQGRRGGQNWPGLDVVVCLLRLLALYRTPPSSLLWSPEDVRRYRTQGRKTQALELPRLPQHWGGKTYLITIVH